LLISRQYLSSLFVNTFTVEASITCWGRLFHSLMTCWLKKCFLRSSLLRCFAIFKLWPLVWYVMEERWKNCSLDNFSLPVIILKVSVKPHLSFSGTPVWSNLVSGVSVHGWAFWVLKQVLSRSLVEHWAAGFASRPRSFPASLQLTPSVCILHKMLTAVSSFRTISWRPLSSPLHIKLGAACKLRHLQVLHSRLSNPYQYFCISYLTIPWSFVTRLSRFSVPPNTL